MGQKRKKHSDEFKARVALEAVRGVRTLSELSSAHGVHPTVIAHWKRQLVDGAATVFSRAVGNGLRTEEEITAPLYEEIALARGLPLPCAADLFHPDLSRRPPRRDTPAGAAAKDQGAASQVVLRRIRP